MDFTGLLTKYKLNRPLTEFEKSEHLLPTEKSPSEPDPHLAVITMNPTYLELVDKYFLSKGFITAWGAFGLSACFYGSLFSYFTPYKAGMAIDLSERIGITAFQLGLSFVLFLLAWVLFKKIIMKEIFRYTHYPIRFNREERKVYVFRLDGTILIEDWDKLFFTVADCDMGWEIRGYRLAKDQQTVLEAFGLPFVGSFDKDDQKPKLWSQWEFIRQYMEEGPEKLKHKIRSIQKVANKKESFWAGLVVLVKNANETSLVLGVITLPVTVVSALGRWVAMRTCVIPRWTDPFSIEGTVAPND